MERCAEVETACCGEVKTLISCWCVVSSIIQKLVSQMPARIVVVVVVVVFVVVVVVVFVVVVVVVFVVFVGKAPTVLCYFLKSM